MSEVKYRGLMRTAENGGRRSRTLMLDDGTAQVQAKEASVASGDRYLQIRYWTEEAGWTHLVVDPSRAGVAGIVAVGHDHDHEDVSWQMAKESAKSSARIRL